MYVAMDSVGQITKGCMLVMHNVFNKDESITLDDKVLFLFCSHDENDVFRHGMFTAML